MVLGAQYGDGVSAMDDKRVYIYDSTLRDGAQTQGVDFTAADKAAVARELDRIGIDYIEGGWPGANHTDDSFFEEPPTLSRARLSAFGMTRRAGRSADNDPGLTALFSSRCDVICLVGKTWDFHAKVALGVGLEENVSMIRDSVSLASKKVAEVVFDAEHFFDGYKENPDFAISCVSAAFDVGARWIVLCDTNGGTLPDEVEQIVGEITKEVPGSNLGIHCHDDTDNAVANSLAAVRAGVRQIQGTLNGLGERCGNANLISVIPSLVFKMGYTTGMNADDLSRLTPLSRFLDERLNRSPNTAAAYVGERAFAHKGGLHVSAIEKDPKTYEHIEPEKVGNQRHILVSDQAGRSNVMARFREIGIEIDQESSQVARLLDDVKYRESRGFAYDGAEASFELLARRVLEEVPNYFQLQSFRVTDERRWNAKGELVTLSEATIKLEVKGRNLIEVAEGNGPVNALDNALRKALTPEYPALDDMRLVDYKVRILTPGEGTMAITRVLIESQDDTGGSWSTVGVSANVIDASYNALHDAITYRLFKAGKQQ